MGANLQNYMANGAEKGYQAKKQEFKQAQRKHQSDSRFGQTSTRLGGLTPDQVGSAPKPLELGKGFIGDFRRRLARRDGIPVEEPRFGRKVLKSGLGFGGANAKLG